MYRCATLAMATSIEHEETKQIFVIDLKDDKMFIYCGYHIKKFLTILSLILQPSRV